MMTKTKQNLIAEECVQIIQQLQVSTNRLNQLQEECTHPNAITVTWSSDHKDRMCSECLKVWKV